MLKHICGQCFKEFKDEKAYLKHRCSLTGYTPRDTEHFNIVYQASPEPDSKKKEAVKISEKDILSAVSAARGKSKNSSG